MTEVFDRGFLEARLTGQQAELIWQTMHTAGCTPRSALGYLLGIAAREMDSGAWDGSTASEGAFSGIRVLGTNLEDITPHKVGDLVVVTSSGGQLIGKVVEVGPVWVQLDLTKGTRARSGMAQGDDLYPVRIGDLQEL